LATGADKLGSLRDVIPGSVERAPHIMSRDLGLNFAEVEAAA
jgi:hypothetical protein